VPQPYPAESESHFRLLLENLPAGAYTCDSEGLITYYNEQAVRLWGRAPQLHDPVDRFCGSFKLYRADDGAPINHDQCWMALALRERRDFNGQEIIIERPDGSRVTGLAHANPIFDADGRLLGAVNILVDISDRKQAEEAHGFLAAIVASSDDAIVGKTLEGRVLSWNAGAERLFGYTAEEMIGQSILRIIPPERRDEETLILSKISRGERIDHFETVRVDKHGRRLDISLTVSPVCDKAGRVIGASKVARDISERKRAESAMRRLKDELAVQLTDLERLHEMSVRLTPALSLQPILEESLRTAAALERADMGLLSIYVAEKGLLELGASLGFDQNFLKIVEHMPIGSGACGTCFREGRRVIVEDVEADSLFAPYRDVARQAGFRAVHATPLVTRSGVVVGVISTHFRRPHRPSDRELRLIDLCARQTVDFIENVRLYEQLRESDRRKDEFLAMLAHELRNPLAPLSNALHILRLSDELGPAVEHVRDIMERQVNQMVRLVEDLLEVSRITRGKIELRKERTDLVAVLGNAVETSRPAIEAAGHRLAISVPPEPLPLDADPVRLAQVVTNLLNNAAKYSDEGGQIWLSARREGSDAVISVKDTGVGISAEMLPHVFEMFAQVDQTVNRAQGGLGIGLTLARRLVELHGGRIDAYSEGPGQGSEFVVRLPLTIGPARSLPPSENSPSATPLPVRRVLVVDDTRAAAYSLAKLLETLGQVVQTADDAESALQMVRAAPFDVVISDIGMPGMNGYELAGRLRDEPAWQGAALVALTGYGQDRDKQRAKEAGFDQHLVKPVSIEALRRLLESLPEIKAVRPG
jgi:PAS domain S-box-containing protein